MIPPDKESDPRPWEQRRRQSSSGALTILVGVTAGTLVVYRLHRTFTYFYNQYRSRSSWRNATDSSHPGGGGFREEARNRYNQRMQEEYEDEMERVERIRRMQSVFNRERSKQKKSYETWTESDHGAYQSQHYQRDDWYWKTNTSYKDQRTNSRSTPRNSGNYEMSHHYSVLGLNWSRGKPYSEAEIKSAFRAKAKQYHPDQNQKNKEAAEAKFKEVMVSYEAVKQELKNGNSSS